MTGLEQTRTLDPDGIFRFRARRLRAAGAPGTAPAAPPRRRCPYGRVRIALAVWPLLLLAGWMSRAPTAAGQTPASLIETTPRDEYIIEHTLKLTKGAVYTALFSPNQKFIVTLGANHALRLWDTESGRVVKELRTGDHEAVAAL